MRTIILSITAGLGLWISGCVTDPTPNYAYDPSIYALDSNVYFRIEFNNDTLTTYGVKSLLLPTNGAILRGSYYTRITPSDPGGNIVNNLDISCMGSLGNQIIAGTSLPRNPIDFIATGSRPDPILGNYLLNSSCRLTDLRETPYVNYAVDNNYFHEFEIDQVDSLYIRGHFRFNILSPSGTQSIAAKGYFQLNNLY